MAGKQGGHVKAPVGKAIVGGKPGGGVVGGGNVILGKTPSPKPGNKKNIKTGR